MRSSRLIRRWAVVFSLSSVAVSAAFVASGCVSPADQAAATSTDTAAQLADRAALITGTTRDELTPGSVRTYDFDVAEGQSLDVTGLATEGALAQLLRVQSPTGKSYNLAAGASVPFDVEDASESAGDGFRLLVSDAAVGRWRITVGAIHAEEYQALRKQLRTRSAVEKLLLFVYLMNGANSNDPLAGFLRDSFPALEAAAQPVQLIIRLNGVEGGDQNGNSNDSGQNGNDNTNANGNSNGNDNANSNSNSNGNDNSNSNSNSNGNSNSNSNGNSNSPTPTKTRLASVAQTGDAVPGQPLAAKFTYFGNPVIDADSRVAFWAAFTGGANGANAGLFYWDGTELHAVVSDDNTVHTVPGSDATAFFGDITIKFDSGAPAVSWGKDGRLLFSAPIQSPFPVGIYRYRISDGDMIRVADMRQLGAFYTDALPNTFTPELFTPVISDAGIAAFATRYTFIRSGPEFVSGKTGVFTSNGVGLTVVADNQLSDAGEVPDQAAAAKFDIFDTRVAMSREGVLMFQATYRSGNGNRGVYLLANGEIVRVLDNGSNRSFTGVPFGATVNSGNVPFDAFAVGEGARLAVDTTLTQNNQTRSAVLLWNGSRWRELTATNGSPSSVLLSGVDDAGEVLFYANSRPHLARANSNVDMTAGVVAELLSQNIRWDTVPGAINNRSRAIVRYYRVDNNEVALSDGIAFWNGERLLVGADSTVQSELNGFDRIYAIARPEQNRCGRSGALSDRDEYVFRVATDGADNAADTADDKQGIFIGTAYAPTPSNE